MKKTEILKIKGDWQEVVDDCRATVKKSPLGKEPSEAFKSNFAFRAFSDPGYFCEIFVEKHQILGGNALEDPPLGKPGG